MARGRRRSRVKIWDFFAAMVANQVAAIVLGSLGILLVSPLPRTLLNAIPVAKATGIENMSSAILVNALAGTALTFLPLIRLFGFSLIAVAAGAMLIRGRDPRYRTWIKLRAINDVVAILFGAVAVILAIQQPPRLPGRRDADEAVARAQGKRTVPTAPDHKSAVHDGGRFPANGTTEWGNEGQPIGGDLETLEIWDTTGSKENKVVRLRSGLVMAMPGTPGPAYVTIYIAAGQRASVRLPKNVPYKVTAMAGTKWKNRDELFSGLATTVDFGTIVLSNNGPQVVAMGAPDQTATIVGNERF